MLHDFNKPGIKFPFSSIYYRDYEMARIKKDESFMPVEKLEEDKKRVRDCFYLSSDIVLIKSFKEIEGKYSDYITKLTGKKVVPIGPLVQEPTLDDGESELITWLNEKEEKSTIFVSFGSEYFLEIAYGLENSKVNFKGFSIGEKFLKEAKILEHSSIGGFVSHCGWSSVMESMKYGVSIVEEVGIAVEVVRDSNGKLHREEVAAIINQVVVKKEGEFVRQKASDMKEMLRSKGDEEVAKELEKLCAKKTHSFIEGF
uniref:Cyanidin-3-O-glucoside 2-O-glucuronosyltransferase-like n=2 Tax=Nicotiana TaxID=4085 RepID=A0A1S4A9D8_TOBAC|nr:PREDICTED: cyanidin-3-O-glucoside 2-O-glucuronosyltransferase-like [Nicotiana sylvestris]XP_016473253.1 PREDICTED: cyanidin-3-O-glucoside 2-O-glucuronosyltransferase-like [Nicotiana tabacum]